MSVFILLLFIGALIGGGLWHVRENKRLGMQWRKTLDHETADRLIRFAWSRSVQLLAAVALATIIIFSYQQQLSVALKVIETLKLTPAPVTEKKPEPPAAPVAQTPPPAQPAAPAAAPAPTAPVPAVVDLYNPEGESSDKQSALDGLKKRYEDVLVTYFFLRKCNRINPNDYHIIVSALSQEMASINAPGRLQNDILTSAQGSYKEIYARSNCDDASTDGILAKYNTYIGTVSKFTAP